MTPDRNEETPDDESNGVLSETAGLPTTPFDVLGTGTAQIRVVIPAGDDDDLSEDDVVDDIVIDDEAEDDSAADPAGDEHAEALTEPHDDAGAHADADETDAERAAVETVETVEAELVDDEPDEVAVDEPVRESHAADDDSPVLAAAEDVPAEVDGAAVEEPAPTPAVAPAAVPAPVPLTRRAAQHEASRAQSRTVELTSKRLGEFDPDREAPDLLTADRLLDPSQVVRPEPEGGWQHFVYAITGHRVNLGDGRKARRRKALDQRIAAPLHGRARFVPVLSRKGGVGKTTITTLLGMALADARDDRVIAIDANPDRGTLAERISRATSKTIRDLVRIRDDVRGYNDISEIVARDETRLDVLASDTDPRVSEALSDSDYENVASLAAHYYSIVLTDTGTGIVDSVMAATLSVSDGFVIVAGLSVDEARLASETLTWLEMNGYEEQVRNAVVVLNTSRPGTPMVRADELVAHFRTRVRKVVRMPYDPLVATGSAITFRDLQPETRLAARELAAVVVEGLRSVPSAA